MTPNIFLIEPPSEGLSSGGYIFNAQLGKRLEDYRKGRHMQINVDALPQVLRSIQSKKESYSFVYDGLYLTNFPPFSNHSSECLNKHMAIIHSLPSLDPFHSKLTVENLRNNEISEISGVDSLHKLEALNLSRNTIKEVKNLNNTKNLIQINLSHNQIHKMNGFQNLLNLKLLDLSENQIKIIKGLERLVKLEELKVMGNPVEKIDKYESLLKLWAITINTDNLHDSEFAIFTSHFRPGREGDYFPK